MKLVGLGSPFLRQYAQLSVDRFSCWATCDKPGPGSRRFGISRTREGQSFEFGSEVWDLGVGISRPEGGFVVLPPEFCMRFSPPIVVNWWWLQVCVCFMTVDDLQ